MRRFSTYRMYGIMYRASIVYIMRTFLINESNGK